jgi:hypothetical protein
VLKHYSLRLPLFLYVVLLFQCEDARSRRIKVLSTLYQVIKDVPCSFLVLIIVLSWRIVSFVDLIKKVYIERGRTNRLSIKEVITSTN